MGKRHYSVIKFTAGTGYEILIPVDVLVLQKVGDVGGITLSPALGVGGGARSKNQCNNRVVGVIENQLSRGLAVETTRKLGRGITECGV